MREVFLNIVEGIGGVAIIAFVVFWVRFRRNRVNNPALSNRMKKYRKYSLILFIICGIIYTPLYSGSSQQKADNKEQAQEDKEYSESSIKADSESKKAASISSAKASSKASSKAYSESVNKKEDSEQSSALKKNEKESKEEFTKGVSRLPDKLSDIVESADFSDSTANITLTDDATDVSDSELKSICYNIWRVVQSQAESDNVDCWTTIKDSTGNTIADTSITGKFKYSGMGDN